MIFLDGAAERMGKLVEGWYVPVSGDKIVEPKIGRCKPYFAKPPRSDHAPELRQSLELPHAERNP